MIETVGATGTNADVVVVVVTTPAEPCGGAIAIVPTNCLEERAAPAAEELPAEAIMRWWPAVAVAEAVSDRCVPADRLPPLFNDEMAKCVEFSKGEAFVTVVVERITEPRSPLVANPEALPAAVALLLVAVAADAAADAEAEATAAAACWAATPDATAEPPPRAYHKDRAAGVESVFPDRSSSQRPGCWWPKPRDMAPLGTMRFPSPFSRLLFCGRPHKRTATVDASRPQLGIARRRIVL